MDFAMRYSAEQEEFRKEFRAWLEENIPRDWQHELTEGEIANLLSPKEFEQAREFQRKLGAKGWRAPTWPKEYGGGGLSVDHAIVIEEELAKRPEFKPYTGITVAGTRDYALLQDLGLSSCAPAIFTWGTEEQKRRMLPPILRGEVMMWNLFSEAEAGSDLASLKMTALRQGDEFVLNGTKMWAGTLDAHADYFYLYAVTDPDAPRHRNLGAFYVPSNLPGITKTPIDMVCQSKNMFFFDNVRIPAECLIGGDTDGWRVSQTSLEVMHGGAGGVAGWGALIHQFIDYARQTQRHGRRLSSDPETVQILADLYITAEIGQLLNTRNYWMRHAGRPMSYEGAQSSLYGKMMAPRLAKEILQVVGPYALVRDPRWAALRGIFWHHQGESIGTPLGGGTPEVQRLIMARRLGLGRTAQQAAPII